MVSRPNRSADEFVSLAVEWSAKLFVRLTYLSRPMRQGLALAMDVSLCLVACWIALSLRLSVWAPPVDSLIYVSGVFVAAWLFASWRLEIYRSIIRLSGNRTIVDLAAACVLAMIPALIIFTAIGLEGVPRTIAVLQPMIFVMGLVVSRLTIRYLVQLNFGLGSERRRRVLIYGAGSAGRQLGQALKDENQTVLVGYLDSDERIVGQRIDGARIFSAATVSETTRQMAIDDIYLALPTISRARRRKILESLGELGVRVRSLPTLGQLADGTVSISDLREISIDELLGREVVSPDDAIVAQAITGRTVMVTGAGGSIGSELCRQIALHHPRRLVLVDNSEYSLYQIEAELKVRSGNDVELVPELADVADASTAQRLFDRHRANTVFHAAAYKHVPMIEANPIAGLRNNVIGTLNCCLAAEQTGVSRFVLVSTDKAVRPTNIMGASKRISELVLQARAEFRPVTVFSMVRFGNVLGSSGSVVPKFREQIARGGPVTVTHRDVTRYFMTIPEAAQLVLHGGAMATGGEVFVLDMKEPVRIIDLARKMIQLSGLHVKDGPESDGDIEIHEIGLRPGEKMYEELLLTDNTAPTEHPSIMRAAEAYLPWSELRHRLSSLAETCRTGDVPGALGIMRELVPEYRQSDAAPLTSEEAQALTCGATGLAEGLDGAAKARTNVG